MLFFLNPFASLCSVISIAELRNYFALNKFLPWLWLLQTTAEHSPATACTFLAFISEAVEIQTSAHAKTPQADREQWPTALRYFQWVMGAWAEPYWEREETRRTDRFGGWRPSRHGNQSWQLLIIPEGRHYGLLLLFHNQEKPLRSRRGENVCREILWIPQRPLYLNANIKVCSGLCGFFMTKQFVIRRQKPVCMFVKCEGGGRGTGLLIEPTARGKSQHDAALSQASLSSLLLAAICLLLDMTWGKWRIGCVNMTFDPCLPNVPSQWQLGSSCPSNLRH